VKVGSRGWLGLRHRDGWGGRGASTSTTASLGTGRVALGKFLTSTSSWSYPYISLKYDNYKYM